jgi:peptidoglycan/LPS O-acetylase OafA/YrhL
MVVTYHVWFGRVSGGVDVFLLISAFLMTLQFVGRHERREPFRLLKHWLHLFRRLLPAAVTVIVATLAASYLVLPKTRWQDVIDQGWASLTYSENRLLQAQAVDYYANDHSLASPLQHFWSLSIQGQVFILWPLIFAAAAWVARRYRLSYRPLLAYVFFVLFLGSLAYSIFFTATNQVQAYFDTGARLWEFALGTLVALILPGLRLSRMVRIVTGWTGVIAMLACGILLNVQAAFPGVAALWPTLAAALVIGAGQTQSPLGVDRILSSTPLVKLGDISYGLYLWHWPLLVLALAWSGKDHAGWLSGTVIIAAALVLAYLTTKFIEKPWREWKWPEARKRRAAIAIILVAGVAAAPLGLWKTFLDHEAAVASANAARNNPGAASLAPGFTSRADEHAAAMPDLAQVGNDWAQYDGGCVNFQDTQGMECTNGIGSSSTKHIVIWGSSHAGVWGTPLMDLAKRYNWAVTAFVKGSCPISDGTDPIVPEDCGAFNAAVAAHVQELNPDVILTTSTRILHSNENPEYFDPSWRSFIEPFATSGTPIVAVRDNPRFPSSVPECLAKEPEDTSACGMPKDQAYAKVSPAEEDIKAMAGVKSLDFSEYFCPNNFCSPIIGNVVTFMDDNHPSATYMHTITPYFEKEFLAATGWTV